MDLSKTVSLNIILGFAEWSNIDICAKKPKTKPYSNYNGCSW